MEDDIACWFVDTDFDGDNCFVRQADFLGGRDPYEKRQSALKAEIDPDAWASVYSTISRPLAAPESGRIPAEVVNHYGDEALRVFPIPAPPSRRPSLIPPPARLFTLVSLCFT